jgi:hypothetical protein
MRLGFFNVGKISCYFFLAPAVVVSTIRHESPSLEVDISVPHREHDRTKQRAEEQSETFKLTDQHPFGAHRPAYFTGVCINVVARLPWLSRSLPP